MEDFIVPPTTTATTMYHKEQPTNIQNRWISNMGRSQNCHIFPIIEGQSVSSAYSMSHSQFHHSSYNLQAHEAVKFPYLCPSDHVFPLVLPSYPYQVDQIGNEIKTPNSLLRDIPDGVPSNGHAGDKVRNTCFMQSLGLSKLHEQERLHALITRAARTKRKMARQKSASLKRNLSNGGSSAVPSSNTLTACAIPTQSNNRNEHKDLYTFCTPDKKRLRMLLTKELKKSDVGNLGRIVLPKREAEENLPSLSSKEGILIVIRDVYSSQEWSMRYRFWSNNNSRMYVLENTGNFVEQNGLDSGDLITFYEEESQNLYFSIKRAEKVAPKPSKKPSNSYFGYIISPFTKEALDEEDSSLEILMEELQHKEEEAKSLMTL